MDPNRIGIMGFSRGGSVAFQTALQPFRKAFIDTDLKFAFHIPMYAGCLQAYWSPQLTKVPMLNLVGDADDWTPTAACKQLAARYQAAGVPIETISYARAGHG
jgi:dienelactone hydrolase